MTTPLMAKPDQTDRELVSKRDHFARVLQSIEVLHRRLLDLVTAELGRGGKTLSSVQALILRHAQGRPISLGELQASGCYEGANLTYNVGKLAEDGYITLARPQWDKRSSRIELTSEGQDVARLVSRLFDSHAGSLAKGGISEADLSLTTRALNGLNRIWSG
jgi:DNA-binding MarR family transcriptional regulator